MSPDDVETNEGDVAVEAEAKAKLAEQTNPEGRKYIVVHPTDDGMMTDGEFDTWIEAKRFVKAATIGFNYSIIGTHDTDPKLESGIAGPDLDEIGDSEDGA